MVLFSDPHETYQREYHAFQALIHSNFGLKVPFYAGGFEQTLAIVSPNVFQQDFVSANRDINISPSTIAAVHLEWVKFLIRGRHSVAFRAADLLATFTNTAAISQDHSLPLSDRVFARALADFRINIAAEHGITVPSYSGNFTSVLGRMRSGEINFTQDLMACNEGVAIGLGARGVFWQKFMGFVREGLALEERERRVEDELKRAMESVCFVQDLTEVGLPLANGSADATVRNGRALGGFGERFPATVPSVLTTLDVGSV